MKTNKKKHALICYKLTGHWLAGRTLASQVEEVLANGATFLQLREKHLGHSELVKEAVIIKEIDCQVQCTFCY